MRSAPWHRCTCDGSRTAFGGCIRSELQRHQIDGGVGTAACLSRSVGDVFRSIVNWLERSFGLPSVTFVHEPWDQVCFLPVRCPPQKNGSYAEHNLSTVFVAFRSDHQEAGVEAPLLPEVDEEAFASVRVVEVGIKPNGLSRSQAMKIEAHIARKRARA